MTSELPPPRLETVYDGTKNNSASGGTIDIVAVHGLGADPKRTWVAKDEKGTDVYWLRDLLPGRTPHARIMCFNYDSRWFGNDLAKQTIPGIAMQLLDRLHHEKPDKERPTIFIGHSFGGVIIEQALVLANSGVKYQSLVEKTAGIVFLGTPFRGSKLQTWGKIIANCIKVVGNCTTLVGASEEGLLKHLQPESEKLDELLDEFAKIAMQKWSRSIICFYELYQTTVVAGTQAMVVDKISGTIPGFAHIALETDHCRFNKFGSNKDPNFMTISDNITELANEACTKSPKLTEGQQRCLQSLFLSDPASDRNYIIDNKGKRIEGTCEWILSHENYTSWLQGTGSQMLWVSGGPGKGKTFTSIFLTGELEKAIQHNKTLIYFFCDNKDERRNTAVAILRGLMHQLLSKRPGLFQYILPDFETQGNGIFTSGSAFQGLWRIFEKMVQSPDSGLIYCVIDALDECEPESLEVLVQYLGNMFSNTIIEQPHAAFKLLITSRDTPACIPDKFSAFGRVNLDSLPLEEVRSSLDIFISYKTKRLFEQKNYPPTLQRDVLDALAKGANGTFLWVALICKELEKKEISEVRDTLESLPRGLDDIYRRILSQIGDKKRHKIVTTILNWVTLAFRPLTLLELSVATNTEPTDSLTAEQVMGERVGYCGPFLQVDEQGHVNLIHQSAKDYLLQVPTNPTDLDIHVNRESASLEIVRKCFDYLQGGAFIDCAAIPPYWAGEEELESEEVRIKKFPLRRYAILNWHEHLRALDSMEDAIDLSAPFFKQGSLIRMEWWKSILNGGLECSPIDSRMDPRGFSMLHMASYLGLTLLVEKIILQRTKIGFILPYYKNRESRINSNSKDQLATLDFAAIGGYGDVVRLLVENGAKVDHRDKHGDTALLRAAYGGHTEIVMFLVKNGAKVNHKDEYGDTALLRAVSGGRTEIVMFLVKNGAEVNHKDECGDTALLRAASWGYTETLMFLVKNGAEVNHKDGYGDTALLRAVSGGHMEIVMFLVKNGAEVNHKDEGGNTALHRVVDIWSKYLAWQRTNQRLATIIYLLENGIDADFRNKKGETALVVAGRRGFKQAIELLDPTRS